MPDFRWSEREGRYRDNRGRYLSRKEVRRRLDTALERGELNARTLSEQFRNREIALREWQAQMGTLVKRSHLQAAMAAKGGVANMTPGDYGAVGARVKEQYRYLQGFADELTSGLPRDGRFLRRAEMYPESGRGAFHQVERRTMEARGFDEEKNMLAPADHCPGCLEEDGRGWVPIGTLVRVGQRDCRSRCKCRVRYRNSTTGAVSE